MVRRGLDGTSACGGELVNGFGSHIKKGEDSPGLDLARGFIEGEDKVAGPDLGDGDLNRRGAQIRLI